MELNEPLPVIAHFCGEYRFLSNFWPCPIEFAGLKFLCAEAAYQAMKCPDPADRERFIQLSGAAAKKEGRKALRPDWHKMRLKVMSEVIHAKFTQSHELRKSLLATAGRLLIEGNFWHDDFWGVYNGRGQNHLGKLLMCERNYWMLWSAIQRQGDLKYKLVWEDELQELPGAS